MNNNITNKIGNRPQTETVSGVNSNHKETYNLEQIVLPLPPNMGEETRFEMELYARFMRHLREVPNNRMEIKILSSIRFVGDIMEVGEALVAKTLVDLGLLAPRKAFPVSFLDFADKGMMRTNWDFGAPPASVLKLHDHWNKIGEDRFGRVMPSQFAVFSESEFITA